jgi:hypothetical protein
MKTPIPSKLTKMLSLLTCIATLAMAVALLAGCGGRLSGTFSASEDDITLIKRIKFVSGNKAEVTMTGGMTQEVPYVVEGDKLKLGPKDGALLLTIDKDGSLAGEGPLGTFKLRKQ